MSRRATTPPATPIPTAASLRAAALHYLARYASSSGNLRRVLLRRIDRAAQQHPECDSATWARLRRETEQIIAACLAKNFLDDAGYGASQARQARAQGKSARAVAARLRQKGLDQTQIAEALAKADAETDAARGDDPEFQAALRLARRRKLGPFGTVPGDETRARRDFAVLARAGFSSAIARRILENNNFDEME